MATPVVVTKFDETAASVDIVTLNANLQAIIAAVNALALDTLLQLGPAPGASGTYMLVTGGTFLGQIAAPSMLIGPQAGPKYNVVTTNDVATEATAGAVKKAAASADTAAAVSAAYAQAEVQAILNELRDLKTKLRNAGIVTP